MWFFYPIAINLYFFGIKIASLWRTDAQKWIDGRKDFFKKIEEQKRISNPHNHRVIWIHASSLGEFEQGRSLIEKIKQNHPNEIIWLTFFSPSAYEIRQNYQYANIISYFPSDKMNEVQGFIELINPKLVLFVKYDFWFNTLRVLTKKSIPYYFISMHLSSKSYLRKPLFSPLLHELKNAKKLFLQTQETYNFLKSNNFTNIEIAGDTRLDRVIEIKQQIYSLEIIEKFVGSKKCLVLGSSWSVDEAILNQLLLKNELLQWKVIIAPHLTDEIHIMQIEVLFKNKTCRFSEFNSNSKILIIDQIGLLSRIYKYADLAYVGGGFGKGIHNTLEVVAHHVPVCFGPKHQKFPEAQQFIDHGFGFQINNSDELLQLIHQSEQNNLKHNVFNSINHWLNKNQGATEKVYKEIGQILKYD